MHKNVFCMQKIFLAKLFIKNEKPGRGKKEIFHDILTKTPHRRQKPRPGSAYFSIPATH